MRYSSVVELRQYTLYPGKRDNLIDLFEREFIDTQESVGINVIGQFRDLDDPDRFVWVRGFPDISQRKKSLSDFYGGPTWKKHRDQANATMMDSNNVLLLRPLHSATGQFTENTSFSSDIGEQNTAAFIAVVVFYLDAPADAKIVNFVEHILSPKLADYAISTIACLETESSPNTFPSLPVREGDQVFVWFIHFHDRVMERQEMQKQLGFDDRSDLTTSGISPCMKKSPEILRLLPTKRSKLS